MWRFLCIAFALFVAIATGTFVKESMEAAAERIEIAGKAA